MVWARADSMSKSATILLVEDDRYLLEGTADLLELSDMDYDIQVLRATNGLEGLELLRHHSPHLIISDIMMPQMNGLEFMVEVRHNPNWVHIPIILLTAKGDREDVLYGRSLGAELYITKPFESAEFQTLVRSQLDRTFQLREAREQNLAQLKQSILQLLNHEFRTPLTYVTAYYEMLADGIDQWESPEALQEYLVGIQAGCTRLGRLVDDLITIIELRTGEAVAAHRAQAVVIDDVGEHLRRAGQQREADARQAGITISYDVAEDLPPILGVPESLDRICRQLVDNAVRFTAYRQRIDGEVRLTTRPAEGGVELSVSDNGIGFPSRVRERIFDLFFQYNRQVLEQQGSGTGLAIVKGLVDLHRGHIEVSSKENRGSTFRMFLPAHDADEADDVDEDRHLKQATLLLVEDDQYLLQGLRDLLAYYYTGPYQFDIHAASNGAEALKMLGDISPDLIISDVMMPRMDGFTFLERVRKNPDWVQIPFIFLTARREKADIEHGRRIGAEEYIAKPYDTGDLMALVTTQLNRYFEVQDVVSQSFSTFKKGILNLFQPDVRQPLDSVSVYSEQLVSSLQTADTDADLKSSLEGLQASSQQLARVVEDFITLAEIRTGEAENAFRYRAGPIVGLSTLFRQLAEAWERHYAGMGLQVLADIEAELPAVYGDVESLYSSLDHLMRTIMALCERESLRELHLGAQSQDDEVHFSIGYQGVAANDRVREALRSAFGQDDEATLAVPDFGPSLAAIKGILGLHKGRIEMDNGDQKHCRLIIALPIHRPDDPPAGA